MGEEMSEEARDWCVTKLIAADKYFYAQHKNSTTFMEKAIAENLSKDEAIALLSTIGEVKSLSEDEFYVHGNVGGEK